MSQFADLINTFKELSIYVPEDIVVDHALEVFNSLEWDILDDDDYPELDKEDPNYWEIRMELEKEYMFNLIFN